MLCAQAWKPGSQTLDCLNGEQDLSGQTVPIDVPHGPMAQRIQDGTCHLRLLSSGELGAAETKMTENTDAPGLLPTPS